MPGGCQRSGFCLAVANHNRYDEIGIVESGSVSVRKGIAEFSAFMNRAGCFWSAVRSDAARKGELLKKLEHAGFIAALVGIDFRIMTFQIAIGEGSWCTVA